MEQIEQIQIILKQLLGAWDEISKRLMQNPENLLKNQMNYWQDYLKLCQGLAMDPGFSSENFFDNRFKHSDWQSHVSFNFIKHTYLLLTQTIEKLINDIASDDEKTANKLRLIARFYLDALSPSNFLNTNPEVLKKIFETNGSNLIQGLKQFLEDLQKGKGFLNIKMTDPDYFKLGENIACTKGKVIYQNALMQLIQYTATTKKVYEKPLLIIPPWINKYYILDLQPENSLVKWLLEQGYTVFMISWVNPDSADREKEFIDYMKLGPLAALDIITEISGQTQINILGYCIGGTLLGCMLAYLQEKHAARVSSASFLTTLFDFSEPGDLGTFINEEQLGLLETFMQKKGYMDGATMAAVFNSLRANDLIWSSFVNNYLKGEKPKVFDLLYWNADASNIPEKVHSFYLRRMYLQNALARGEISFENVPINLKKIKTPAYFLAAQDDHIVPWKSSFMSKNLLSGKTKFVLTTSGHVAGVVNPPQKKKYGYWTSTKKTQDPAIFLETAVFHEGSWWQDWELWLREHSGDLTAKKVKNKKALEAAPGSYVQKKINGNKLRR